MKTEDDYRNTLNRVNSQWNKAENAIKLAEQVNGKVVNPAVFELRYAGRRMVEAETSRQNGDMEAACARLEDAHFDCCRAQHDAIDAATAKIGKAYTAATNRLSPKTVISIFPQYSENFQKLHAVRKKISASRENRNCRDAVYDAIANVDLPKLIEDYVDFTTCVPLMKRQAQFDRGAIVIGALITLAVGIAVGLAVDLFKQCDNVSPPAVERVQN